MRTRGTPGQRSAPFAEKKSVYTESPQVLTSQIAQLAAWTRETVEARQHRLAELALRA
jgi:hypothetical protein